MSARICRRCGGPNDRVGRAWYCSRCVVLARREARARFRRTPRGRACERRWIDSPRRKLWQARYADAHPERMHLYQARYRAKRWLPTIVRCAAQPCPNTFVRGRQQGKRRYCDECVIAFYGPSILRRRLPEVPARKEIAA